MHRTGASEVGTKAFLRGLLAVLLLSLADTSCDNTCFIFVSNPSTGTLVVGGSSCSLTKANGTIRLHFNSPLPTAGLRFPGVHHLILSLKGIEAHPSALADEDSSDWQGLAPNLAKQPIQVDFMASTEDPSSPSLFGVTVVAAGVYRQVRLRLVPNRPTAGEPIPEKNFCGSAGFNCVVTSDGSIRSLVLDGGELRIRIPSEHIAGGFFHVLPDTNTDLTIQFKLYSSMAATVDEAVHLIPVFTVHSEFSSDSREESER
jgi:Domain of unknown function (DUF4382)